jgi:tetratricopeptide (TPR) repeat protein
MRSAAFALPFVLSTSVAVALARPAAAGTRLDAWTGSVGAVTLAGPVEVPLYRAPWGGTVPCVAVKVGEDVFLFELHAGSDHIIVNDAVVGAAGAKAQGKNKKLINLQGKDAKWRLGGEISTVTLEKVSIGGLDLGDVVALTKPQADATAPDRDKHESTRGMPEIAGSIGLGALGGQLAWAILPSQGVVRFDKPEGGAALASAVGGAALPVTATESAFVKFGKDKFYLPAQPFIVEIEVGGAKAPAALDTRSRVGELDRSLAAAATADAPAWDQPNHERRWYTVSAGGQDLGAGWFRLDGGYGLVSAVVPEAVGHRAVVGLSALRAADLAHDPVAKALVVKRVADTRRADPAPVLREAAEAAKARSIAKAAEAATKDPPKDGAPPAADGSAGDWARVAGAAFAAGDHPAAAAAWAKAAELDANACARWVDAGLGHFYAGKLDDAAAAFTKADGLYAAWWSRELQPPKGIPQRQWNSQEKGWDAVARAEYGKRLKKAGTDAEARAKAGIPEGLYEQPDSCQEAASWLAATHYVQGSPDKALDLFRTRFDLHTGLAVVAGNAALGQGQSEVAHAAYRQAATKDLHPAHAAREGVALVRAEQGDSAESAALLRRVIDHSPRVSLVIGQAWLGAVRVSGGPAAAVDAARALAMQRPDDATAAALWALEASTAGDTAAATKANAWAEQVVKATVDAYPTRGWAKAAQITAMQARGELTAARQVGERAVEAHPASAELRVALAGVYAAEGNAEASRQMLRAAVQVAPLSPALAARLAGAQDAAGEQQAP